MEAWFSKGLMRWYRQNKRDLPWREEKDPYKIWLSEVILQQTQVTQGLSYYNLFIANYPTVQALASASEDAILKHWQGLGYYSRARNLHFAAKSIVKDFKGQFPTKYEDIRNLKGVGDYSAAAIASFSYNLPYAVVDGNVYRLLSRVFGITEAIDTNAAKKKFQLLANDLLDTKQPGIYNQAIMEFGSQYCKPANPNCLNCIFQTKCFAFKQNQVSTLPFKEKKIKIKKRYFNYIVQADKEGQVKIYKRSENDIWKGLYEFFLIETSSEFKSNEILKHKKYLENNSKKAGIKFVSKCYKHVLSHQHLMARFYVLQSPETFKINNKRTNESKNPLVIKENELHKFAFARLTLKFFEDCILKEIL